MSSNFRHSCHSSEVIQKSLDAWFKRHKELQHQQVGWAVKYLENNPISDAKLSLLGPSHTAIMDYICSSQRSDEIKRKIENMQVGWRVEKRKIVRKLAVHYISISENGERILLNMAARRGTSKSEVVEDLLQNASDLSKTIRKQEQDIARERVEKEKSTHQSKIRQYELGTRRMKIKHEREIADIIKNQKHLINTIKDFQITIDDILTDPPTGGIYGGEVKQYLDHADQILSRLPKELRTLFSGQAD